MTVSLENNLLINNLSDPQGAVFSATSQRKKSFKSLQNWSAIIQCSGSKYSGISIPARKHALSIIGYCSQSKITFAFNVTYSEQVQEISYELSKKIKRYIENTASIKFWKILPYKNPREGVSSFIDNWLSKELPNISIESIKLKKDSCFIIDRTNGYTEEQCEPESLCGKFFRQVDKFCSIVSHQEKRIKKTFRLHFMQ